MKKCTNKNCQIPQKDQKFYKGHYHCIECCKKEEAVRREKKKQLKNEFAY